MTAKELRTRGDDFSLTEQVRQFLKRLRVHSCQCRALAVQPRCLIAVKQPSLEQAQTGEQSLRTCCRIGQPPRCVQRQWDRVQVRGERDANGDALAVRHQRLPARRHCRLEKAAQV